MGSENQTALLYARLSKEGRLPIAHELCEYSPIDFIVFKCRLREDNMHKTGSKVVHRFRSNIQPI